MIGTGHCCVGAQPYGSNAVPAGIFATRAQYQDWLYHHVCASGPGLPALLHSHVRLSTSWHGQVPAGFHCNDIISTLIPDWFNLGRLSLTSAGGQ